MNKQADPLYIVTIKRGTVGSYGTGEDGAPWASWYVSSRADTPEDALETCADCGKRLWGGWSRGRLGEQTYHCAEHVRVVHQPKVMDTPPARPGEYKYECTNEQDDVPAWNSPYYTDVDKYQFTNEQEDERLWAAIQITVIADPSAARLCDYCGSWVATTVHELAGQTFDVCDKPGHQDAIDAELVHLAREGA